MAEGRELELLISHLRNVPISEEPDKYTDMLESIRSHPHKAEIIDSVLRNVDNNTVFLSVIPAYLRSEASDASPSILLKIIEKSRSVCIESQCNFDMLCPLLFACLSERKLLIEVKSAVFKIFEETAFDARTVRSAALVMLQHEHTTNILTEVILYISAMHKMSEERRAEGGEEMLSGILEYLLVESEASKSTGLQKNYSSLILKVGESIRMQGVFDLIEPLTQSITSEVQCIRNSAIESAVLVCRTLKGQIEQDRKGEKELFTVLSAVIERASDVSPFCRSRAVHSLTDILCNHGILEDLKGPVYAAMQERIMDKTQIVRRKAILFFKRAVETHPYALDGGTLSADRIQKHKSTDAKYYESAMSFYQAIHASVENIKRLIHAGSKGEITEIIQYISLCYSYGIENALEVFPSLFLFSWQRLTLDGRNTADTLSEELRRMADGSSKRLIDLMLHFDSDTLAYEGIIRELTLRGILGIEAVNTLFYRIDAQENIACLRLLRRISATDRSVTESALPRIHSILARSENIPVISECVRILGNLDYRLGNTSETIQAIVKSLERVDEANLELLQAIIDTGYLVSTDPDSLAVDVLGALVHREMRVPVIFAVGHIAIKEAVHLERVEAAWSYHSKHTPANPAKKHRDSVSCPEIRERRLSVGSRKNSMKNTTEEQEEMADRVFFSKEHEIIFGEESVLKSFLNVVVCGLGSSEALVKKISLISLGKIMSVSSECSTRFMPQVVQMLSDEESEVQVIALVIISDSVMAFSSLVKSAGASLFLPLRSDSEEVRMTALVLIRHLLRSGMIKVKDNYWSLSLLLLEESTIRATAQKLFEEASERETPMKIICEVIKSYLIEKGAAEAEGAGEPGDEHQQLVLVVKSLLKISGVADLPRKLCEWAASKNDAAVNAACSAVVEEVSKASVPA
ncbi:uncharacterized protein NEMAJ01_1700 [Nematocida major]|uniref:uncharacterized protein n=1 Tax=Nematocida major TaxID=1912982 RepID=UPI002008A76D|nr:uncharacterized protein NEMAJ01_1700 [Nematocida major]KAH9386804.1 hypothetical protein NEMAJ01_1700 [Nematocida major]